jgi:hypothetical protein
VRKRKRKRKTCTPCVVIEVGKENI